MPKAWRTVEPDEYLALPLRAHEVLDGVPLHDVWCVALPGGGPGRTMMDVRRLREDQEPSGLVRLLFAIRRWLGNVFGWDHTDLRSAPRFITRVSDDDLARSLVTPGSHDGPFTVGYVHEQESMSEVRNRTVHAALVFALQPAANGYELFWGVYVQPVTRMTGAYMALIAPFRRFIVYPSLLTRLSRSWATRYQESAE